MDTNVQNNHLAVILSFSLDYIYYYYNLQLRAKETKTRQPLKNTELFKTF